MDINRKCYLIFFHFLISSYSQNWWRFQGITDNIIRTLYYDSASSKIYVAGPFTEISGLNTRGIATYDGFNLDSLQSGIDYDSTINTSPGNVLTIQRYNNDIFIGGSFHSTGNIMTNSIGMWDGSSWIDPGVDFNGTILKLKKIGDTLYVGGAFDSINSFNANGLVKYYAGAFSPVVIPNFNTHLNNHNLISDMEYYKGMLFVGGNFEGDSGRKGIAYFNGNLWTSLQNGLLGSIAWVSCMCVYKNELYIGGTFSTNDGNLSNSIVRWDGVNWIDMQGGLGGVAYPQVYDMEIIDSNLYVVGTFKTAGGLPCSNMAKWDGSNWCSINGQFDNGINAIQAYNDSIVVGGNFWTIDNDSILFIAKTPQIISTDSCGSVSIPEIEQMNFSIYPNPTSGTFSINLDNFDIGSSTIKLKNVLGQILKEYRLSNSVNIFTENISEYERGIYFISIYSNGKIHTFMIIKNE